MSNKRGICVVKFDDLLGPICIYSQGLDEHFTQKVCVKSHISTLSLTSNSPTEDFIESVIPFTDEGFIAYSIYFFIKDQTVRGGMRTYGIVTLVDRIDQMALYKSIPDISNKIKRIAKDTTFNDRIALENIDVKLMEDLNELVHFETLSVDLDQENDSIQMIKDRLKTKDAFDEQTFPKQTDSIISEGSFEFLFKKLFDDLDKIIFALLRSERILVFGRREEITLILETLRWFLPHKRLYNDLWTVPLVDAEALFSRSSDSTTLHVLGIQRESISEIVQLKDVDEMVNFNPLISASNTLNIPLDSKIIIDLDKGQVIGGIKNRFCTRIVEAIKNKEHDIIINIISEHIEYLLERVFDLTQLVLEDANKKLLEQFIANSIEGEISLLVTIIAETNPIGLRKMLQTFSENQLSLDILF